MEPEYQVLSGQFLNLLFGCQRVHFPPEFVVSIKKKLNLWCDVAFQKDGGSCGRLLLFFVEPEYQVHNAYDYETELKQLFAFQKDGGTLGAIIQLFQ